MDRPTKTQPDPIFFAKPSELHAWLEKNHDKASEIWVGFHKKSSGQPSITWPESVDEALCFGWIDSVRKSVNDTSYTNRFTKRKARSTWSAVNIRRAKELISLGPCNQPRSKHSSKARMKDLRSTPMSRDSPQS